MYAIRSYYDDNGNANTLDDIVWVGTAAGTLYRSLLPSEGGSAGNDPVLPSQFTTYTLAGSPGITSLSVDKLGRLWIGTGSRGVQVFDLGETLVPPQPNLRDPFDFNIDGDVITSYSIHYTKLYDPLRRDDGGAVRRILGPRRGGADPGGDRPFG